MIVKSKYANQTQTAAPQGHQTLQTDTENIGSTDSTQLDASRPAYSNDQLSETNKEGQQKEQASS